MAVDHEEAPDRIAVEDRVLSVEEMDDLLAGDDQPPEVTYSTQDFPVDALVKRIERGSMRIPQFGVDDPAHVVAGFQRGFVWTKAQMDRFIESLLLGYPVPGIFLVRQADNVMLILDGQQRLETLRRFYRGLHADRVFKLENVSDDFKGFTYESLSDALRLKLDDSFMHATVVSTDGSKAVNDAIYGIFERLNAGGTQLTPHEIRVALYAGHLMVLVEQLNAEPAWRDLYGPPNRRIRDHELVMRIIALFLRPEKYSRPLKKFLNDFSSDLRDVDALPDRAGELFREAARAINGSIGRQAFRRTGGTQLNAAQAEAIMVAVMRNITEGKLTETLPGALSRLRESEEFDKATTRATADNEAVRDRLREATRVLGRE